MANAHVIEKGLSFEKPRIKFGKIIIKTLIILIHQYIRQKYPINNFAFQSAIQVLQDYVKFHHKNNVFLGETEKKILQLTKYKLKNIKSSTIFLNRKSYFKGNSFADIITHRRSVRNFSEKPVKLKKIKKAVAMALNSPSVCNRQSWHVYIARDKKIIDQALNFQRGNRGFKEKIKTLLIITTDLNSFQGFNERNQCYIDGGLFSMSLLFSLHYFKLAACPMNWSSNFNDDLGVRKVLKIKKSETIMMFVAVGNMPSTVKVPLSKKKQLPDVLRVLN
jgi:nitroreductase